MGDGWGMDGGWMVGDGRGWWGMVPSIHTPSTIRPSSIHPPSIHQLSIHCPSTIPGVPLTPTSVSASSGYGFATRNPSHQRCQILPRIPCPSISHTLTMDGTHTIHIPYHPYPIPYPIPSPWMVDIPHSELLPKDSLFSVPSHPSLV